MFSATSEKFLIKKSLNSKPKHEIKFSASKTFAIFLAKYHSLNVIILLYDENLSRLHTPKILSTNTKFRIFSSINKANNSFGNVSENLLFFHFHFYEFLSSCYASAKSG